MSNKPKSKCASIKNPCKYCLTQVTNKSGLQCQGACKKWAHFKCLHYTPGKISDIKAGIIKVMCPCPDCETTQEKEFLTNPPFTCSNHKCPGNATSPPKCDSNECPSNKKKPGKPVVQCSKNACADDANEFPSPTMLPPPRKNCPPRSASPPPRCSPIPKSYMTSERRPPMKPRNNMTAEAACSDSYSSCSSCDESPKSRKFLALSVIWST